MRNSHDKTSLQTFMRSIGECYADNQYVMHAFMRDVYQNDVSAPIFFYMWHKYQNDMMEYCDADNNTALHHFAASAFFSTHILNSGIMDTLIKKPLSISYNNEGKSPADIAMRDGNVTLYLMYLIAEADSQEMVPFIAERILKLKLPSAVFQYFFNKCAHRIPYYTDEKGNTMLHYMATNPRMTRFVPWIATEIMQHPDKARNRDNKTPVMIAKESGNKEFVDMFRTYRAVSLGLISSYSGERQAMALSQEPSLKRRKIPSDNTFDGA